MNKIELLAPAGDMERLQMAVAYGADAVYLAVVDIVIPQGVVEVLAVRRVEGGDDGLHAGVGDGGGGQALVHIGVVGGVDGLVPLAGFLAFDFLQDIPLGDYRRLEGYLMPATYEFYTPHDPVYAINKFLVYFYNQTNETLMPDSRAR